MKKILLLVFLIPIFSEAMQQPLREYVHQALVSASSIEEAKAALAQMPRGETDIAVQALLENALFRLKRDNMDFHFAFLKSFRDVGKELLKQPKLTEDQRKEMHKYIAKLLAVGARPAERDLVDALEDLPTLQLLFEPYRGKITLLDDAYRIKKSCELGFLERALSHALKNFPEVASLDEQGKQEYIKDTRERVFPARIAKIKAIDESIAFLRSQGVKTAQELHK